MTGSVVLEGAAKVTATLAGDVAVALPAELDAVTTTRRVDPLSAAAGVYELSVAPVMLTQLLPPEPQRCHW